MPALLAALVMAITMSSVALAAEGLHGTYRTTITSPAQLKGNWTLTLAQGGTYAIALNGQTLARGRYTSTVTTITLDRERGSGCTGAGTYAWKKTGKTLTFVRKRETSSCKARATVLAHRFTRVR